MKCVNPTRGRSWFFHLSWARGVFDVKLLCPLFPHSILLDFHFCTTQKQPVRTGSKTVFQHIVKIGHHNSPTSCGRVLSKSTFTYMNKPNNLFWLLMGFSITSFAKTYIISCFQVNNISNLQILPNSIQITYLIQK